MSVASAMYCLYKRGSKGHAVLKGDELILRSFTEPFRKDGGPLPEDIGYWKAKKE